jgi:DNA repair protein RadC
MGMIEIAELSSVHGIGPAKAAQIKALFELSRRIHSSPPQRRRQILSSAELFRVYAPYFKYKRKEIFKSVLLDGKHRILRDVIVSEGSLTLSVVHPREAFNSAIRESAAAIIFLHNHPSGDPTPSPEDIETTRRLVEVGELVGIRVLDHIIIGDGRYVSFSDQGLLTKGNL